MGPSPPPPSPPEQETGQAAAGDTISPGEGREGKAAHFAISDGTARGRPREEERRASPAVQASGGPLRYLPPGLKHFILLSKRI